MVLCLHDTARHETRPFVPLDPAGQAVGMYVCGPTVYDLIHIGNARPLVVFDLLYRLLRSRYASVRYVRNITDVDDKINARAAERGVDIADLTVETTRAYHADARALGVLSPDVEPRATAHIGDMIAMIERLISHGHAYAAEGHVLFAVASMPEYGQFARKDREELVAGARVEVAPYKRDAADFVLWKPSPDDLPGWESPWGRGRPGWHIECSAMSERHLGPDFDIHGGGLDLIFPHHQNEIAQSCCANPGHGFARYWMHNGYLMSEGEKMSKSLGNFYTVRGLLQEFSGEVLRLVLLQTHYRQPMDFSRDKCRETKATLDRFYRVIGRICRDDQLRSHWQQLMGQALTPADDAANHPLLATFWQALDDDLNSPLALVQLHELVGRIAAMLPEDGAPTAPDAEVMAHCTALSIIARILGLFSHDPLLWFKNAGLEAATDGVDSDDSARIDRLVQERIDAKKARDFAKADAIRDALKAEGIMVEDKPGGLSDWRRV